MSRTRRLVEPPAPRRRPLSQEEALLWQAVVRDTQPLPGRAVAVSADAPKTAPLPSPPLPPGAPPARPSAHAPHPRRSTMGDLAHGHAPGLDRRTLERMTRGEMPIDASLDLHGHVLDRARGALIAFIDGAWASGRRCVLVVTGKGVMGTGALKSEVPRWLNQSPLRERVIGFAHARPQHGGEGALYILVRRRRDLG